MVLTDSIKIDATPEAIFRFFEEIERHYLQWHPDHVLFKWVSGRGVREGNIFYFEEYIAGKLLKKKVVFRRVVPGQHIEFVPTFWLLRFFLPRMVFRIEQQPDGCLFIAEVHLRMGPLAAKLNEKELNAVRQHMKLEGENIKHIVEQEQEAAAGPAEATVNGT